MPIGTIPPIFEKYDISELARRLEMSEAYLVELKKGTKPIRPKFKVWACALLGEGMEELFGVSDAQK